MSDTPRTDSLFEFWNESPTPRAFADHAHQLERELTAAQAEALKLQEENAKLQERVKRLEKAGDEVDQALNWQTKHSPASKNWRKAKDTQ